VPKLNLFCRTARVLAGSLFCQKSINEKAREDARGPAEEVE
jgi:hypothetical protein